MKHIITYALIGLIVLIFAGCANPMHSAWAYKPLHNAKSAAFEPAPKKLNYREFDTVNALAVAEADMHRDGYVMIGYVNMLSPQPQFIGRGGAKKWGNSVGASHALHTFGRGHYLATYWAKPKNMPLGAFYVDDVPEEARNALQNAFDNTSGVLVEIVISDSPAFYAGIRPGDLLIAIDHQKITSSANMDVALQARKGQTVTLTVWSMFDGSPRNLEVELN